MRSTWFIRAGRAALALAMLVALAGVVPASAKPAPGRPTKRSGLNLFALTFGVMNVNRVFCGINNIGEVCVDPTNSPVVGGGFWPKGTPDQYVFNSGLQLAGTIPASAGFDWAGDTVGAFFMDPRGDQNEGDPITLVYNSLDRDDATGANWPTGAYVHDTAIYHPILVARADSGLIKRDGSGIGISQQDLWVRTWDGNPAFTGGAREHPMGVLVEERGLGWNFPTGNEDIVYFIYTFYNVTASNPAVYSGIDPDIQAQIAAVGANYQALNEAKYGFNLPDNGYPITNMFAAFFADMDVGDAGLNYATAVVPFAMGLTYKSNFLEPNWVFPADIFGAPFVPSPGFIGVKYLRSPNDALGQPIGLSMFSNTLNSGTGYPDPVGVKQLFRYLSGGSSPAAGDNPCTFQGQQLVLHFCFVAQNFADARFFQSSGPMTLNPGEAQTIVVAYIFAAPTPVVVPFIGGDFKPGIPASGDTIAANPARVRPIERAMGWVSQTDANADQTITQDEVQTVPRSLLGKALVAQAVYDNKFLLPFAPDPPQFFLVPGDDQVTIAWQRSGTETVKAGGGDPYFSIASDPTSRLYDPNFRQYDVEGYRIYRGRTTGALSLVAQFDYAGTSIVDFSGSFAYTTDLDGDGISECAPELGVQGDCPTTFPSIAGEEHSLVGDIVQIPAGGRVQLANGSILILKADTAVTGGNSGFPALTDAGVTFAYVDRAVRNSFTYYYAVTAFDVNSFTSGPSALESPRVTQSTIPRGAGSNTTATALVTGVFGADGTELDPGAQYPTIDTLTGTFSGNMPPANAAALVLGSAVSEALPQGDISVQIDSVSKGLTGGIGTGPTLYLTLSAAGNTIQKSLEIPQPAFSATGNTSYSFDEALVPYDSVNAVRFGMSGSFITSSRMPITYGDQVVPIVRTSIGVALAAGRFGTATAASQYLAHSRWFDPGKPEPADPTISANADSAHNSGGLTSVSKIWAPASYRDITPRFRQYGYAQTTWYPADFLVTWNADSSITVFDSTHHSPLPFTAGGGTGWGFLNVAAYTALGYVGTDLVVDGTDLQTPDINAMTYSHVYAFPPVCDAFGLPCITLSRKAQFEGLDLNHDGTQDASGVVLDVNGEVFFFAMASIPAAGTKWRLRQVTGSMTATCTPAIQPVMTDCSRYTFAGASVRQALAPGLTYKITVETKYTVNDATSGDLARVHTVPDPYYVTNALEATANTKILKFVNLPSRAIIRVYSLSGVLVQVLTHNDAGGSGEATWNLRNRNNQVVASGVYFYHVEGPDGKAKVGRFTVVNFAP